MFCKWLTGVFSKATLIMLSFFHLTPVFMEGIKYNAAISEKVTFAG